MTNFSNVQLDEVDAVDVFFHAAVRGLTSVQADEVNVRPEGVVLRWSDTSGTSDLQFTAFVPWSNVKYLSQVKEV